MERRRRRDTERQEVSEGQWHRQKILNTNRLLKLLFILSSSRWSFLPTSTPCNVHANAACKYKMFRLLYSLDIRTSWKSTMKGKNCPSPVLNLVDLKAPLTQPDAFHVSCSQIWMGEVARTQERGEGWVGVGWWGWGWECVEVGGGGKDTAPCYHWVDC